MKNSYEAPIAVITYFETEDIMQASVSTGESDVEE